MRRAFLAATVLTPFLAVAAQAQPVSGVYVGAGVGANIMMPEFDRYSYATNATGPLTTGHGSSKIVFDPGVAGVVSLGYGFGNGFRIEGEGDYRYNALQHGGPNPPYEQKYGGMVNVLFDFDIGSPYVFPYIGAGGGYMERSRQGGIPIYSAGGAAYQGIAGLSLPIPFVVGLSATLEYRFLGLAGISHKFDDSVGSSVSTAQVKYANDLNNSLMVGLRYAFNVAPPPVPPAAVPVPVAAPAPAAARSYLVFFDWDRADLTARARQIVAEAAQNVGRVAHTSIEVNGNADRSGTPQYNQGLSLRRAEAVSAELVRDGVPRAAIDIHAFGDTKPLVPTAAGVREPQNRRVEIIIK